MNSDRFNGGYYESAYNRTVWSKIEGAVTTASLYTSEELRDMVNTIQQQHQTSQTSQTSQSAQQRSKKS